MVSLVEIIVLVFIVLFIVGVVILAAALLIIVVIMGFLALIAFAASAGGKESGKTKEFLHFQSKAVKGMEPSAAAWASAAESLGLSFTQSAETLTRYGYGRIEGEVQGRQVSVGVRSYGNLRYTVTTVAVPPGFQIPDAWGPVLSRKTKQGMAFVSHTPTLKLDGQTLRHEAIGVRSQSPHIIETLKALLTLESAQRSG